MEGHHQQHHLLINQQQQQHIGMGMGSSGNLDTSSSENRLLYPQWSIQETKELIGIRAELDQRFMESKRNKLIWDHISTRMRDYRGYNRSPEQCKCKWKNLVTRYKGCETMEPEAAMRMHQFPFYSEMQEIFAARVQRMLWIEAEGGGASGSKHKKSVQAQLSSDDDDDEDEDEDENPEIISEGDKLKGGGTGSSSRKKKKSKLSSNTNNGNGNLREILGDFMKQQMKMEAQWRRAYEAREEKRKLKEMEWRQTMKALENERIMMDRRWREREEQIRLREEARADQRDALITVLLNKLTRE